ncbi:MAG: DUF4115 domain-containing protein [Thioalkalispiraceae bacterium]|jgi:cytoskeleton protein RodZ
MSEHTHTDEIDEAAAEESKPVALPGHRLRLTREDLHLSRDEVAHHLHLDVNIVDALESDNYDALPSPAYICGYLRSYARILKLPEDEIVNAYSKGHEINAALIPESVSIQPEKSINPAVFKPVFVLVIVLLIAAGLMWLAERFHMFDVKPVSESTTIEVPVPESTASDAVIERPVQVREQIQQYNAEQSAIEQLQDSGAIVDLDTVETDADTATTDAANSAPLLIDEKDAAINAAEVNVPAAKGDLKLVYTQDSWTEVNDSAGERHVYRLVDAGSEIYVDGVAPFIILLGNADGVEVYYKDELFNHQRFQRDEIAYFRLGTTEEQ